MPELIPARGIDVSHHRGVIDWQEVKDSGIVSFAFLKATDGGSFIDPRFDYNFTQSRRAGLIRGAYHFFRPLTDPVLQAKHYLSVVGDTLHSSDLAPVLDIEAYPPSVRDEFNTLSLQNRLQRMSSWLQTIEAATGRIPIIYTNQSTWQATLGNSDNFTRHPLWIANYGVDQPNIPANNWGDKGWTFWQYTAGGIVPGINDGDPPVDMNLYQSSLVDLRNWLNFTGDRALPPEITNGQMMDSIILAAQSLNSDPNDWIERTGLKYLSDPSSNRIRPYDGAAVIDLPLSDEEKNGLELAIQDLLDSGGENPLGHLTNQEMINAFYSAANRLGTGGWTMLERAQLTYMIHSRDSSYTGPEIEEMPNLTREEKDELYVSLGLTPPVDPPEIPGGGSPGDEPYAGITNQDVINAVYGVGNQVNILGWDLIEAAELTSIINDRPAIYSGPRLEDLPNISTNIKLLLAIKLELDEDDYSFEETYPGLVNQDLINIFFGAASQVGENGWNWVETAGLQYMADSRAVRFLAYLGPKIEDMPNLIDSQKTALSNQLAQLVNDG